VKRLLRWLGSVLHKWGAPKQKPVEVYQISTSMFGDVFGLGNDGLVYYWTVADTANANGEWVEYRYGTYLSRQYDVVRTLKLLLDKLERERPKREGQNI
jgi:hypothetical protein